MHWLFDSMNVCILSHIVGRWSGWEGRILKYEVSHFWCCLSLISKILAIFYLREVLVFLILVQTLQKVEDYTWNYVRHCSRKCSFCVHQQGKLCAVVNSNVNAFVEKHIFDFWLPWELSWYKNDNVVLNILECCHNNFS